MERNKLYSTLERIAELETRISTRTRKPITGLDFSAQAEDMHALAEHTQSLRKVSIADLVGYHRYVLERLNAKDKEYEKLKREYDDSVRDFEARLKQAELDRVASAIYSATLQG